LAKATLEQMRELDMLEFDENEGLERVHDWDDWNPKPKEDRTNAERQRRWRERRNAARNAVTNGVVTPSEVEAEGEDEAEEEAAAPPDELLLTDSPPPQQQHDDERTYVRRRCCCCWEAGGGSHRGVSQSGRGSRTFNRWWCSRAARCCCHRGRAILPRAPSRTVAVEMLPDQGASRRRRGPRR
jgi:hypothetical protein